MCMSELSWYNHNTRVYAIRNDVGAERGGKIDYPLHFISGRKVDYGGVA